MTVTTIDTTLPGDLFRHVEHPNVQEEDSARHFQMELRKRLKAEFPKANVVRRWSPNLGETDVLTLPPGEPESAKRVHEIVDGLLAEPDAWVSRA